MVRVLICGDRHWRDITAIRNYVRKLPEDTLIIVGDARGADNIAFRVATALGIKAGPPFRADWERYGKSAGPIRNGQMLKIGKPDIVVGFHNDISKSKGTRDMLRQADKKGVKTELVSVANGVTMVTRNPQLRDLIY
jgi:hypothetical protein